MKSFVKSLSTLVFLSALAVGCSTQGTAQPSVELQRSRALVAEAMFQDRCKTAGEKIHKTVENVEGFFLMKVRPKEINFDNQFAMDDPYGRDFGGDAYFGSFLRGRYQFESKDIPVGAPPRLGYRYVEAIDPQDGRRYRYTGEIKDVTRISSVMMGGDGKTTFKTRDFVLDRVLASGPTPRYGVTYNDISTREEREYWIAGSSLKVIDLQTNEIIAERVGYMMDWAQGSRAGGRSPWLFAADTACPDFYRNYKNLVRTGRSNGSGGQPNQTLDFVEKVLKPSK